MGHFVGLHVLSTQKEIKVAMLEIVKVEMAPKIKTGRSSMHVCACGESHMFPRFWGQ